MLDLLDRTNMSDANSVTTLMASSTKLFVDDKEPFSDPTQYRQVGVLQCLTLTRPDLSFDVNKVSQIMHKPSTTHWTTMK